jgi:hypothetical protein
MFRATLAHRQAVHSCVQLYEPCTAVYSCTNRARLCTDVYSCTNRAQLYTDVLTLHSCIQLYQPCTAVYSCTNLAQLYTDVLNLHSSVFCNLFNWRQKPEISPIHITYRNGKVSCLAKCPDLSDCRTFLVEGGGGGGVLKRKR